MIDKGHDVLDIAKYFGGLPKLLELTKKYPYLNALVQTKLGGQLHCSAEGEGEVMVAFNLNFIITAIDEDDMDVPDESFYNAAINIIIPELMDKEKMSMLYSWLWDYLIDLGSEVASFNDRKLNLANVWVSVNTINGIKFVDEMSVSDSEILEIIPDEYISG